MILGGSSISGLIYRETSKRCQTARVVPLDRCAQPCLTTTQRGRPRWHQPALSRAKQISRGRGGASNRLYHTLRWHAAASPFAVVPRHSRAVWVTAKKENEKSTPQTPESKHNSTLPVYTANDSLSRVKGFRIPERKRKPTYLLTPPVTHNLPHPASALSQTTTPPCRFRLAAARGVCRMPKVPPA